MSKGKSKGRRDTADIASGVDPLLIPSAFPRSGRDLLDVEDRRSYFPAVYRPAKTNRGWAKLSMPKHRLTSPSAPRSGSFSSVVSFRVPRSTMICVRRHRRREVLFAKAKAGRGRMGRPRRNAWSNFSCKR